MKFTIEKDDKNKKFYVIRDGHRIIDKKEVKGSNLTRQQAIELFKENGSFDRNIKIEKVKLTNVSEYTISSKKGEMTYSRPKKLKIVQYFMSGDSRGEHIAVRSQRIDASSPFARNSKEAKKECRDNFIRALYKVNTGKSDIKENSTEDDYKVTNFREGWIYYVKNP